MATSESKTAVAAADIVLVYNRRTPAIRVNAPGPTKVAAIRGAEMRVKREICRIL
jgi:hypothetical protein